MLGGSEVKHEDFFELFFQFLKWPFFCPKVLWAQEDDASSTPVSHKKTVSASEHDLEIQMMKLEMEKCQLQNEKLQLEIDRLRLQKGFGPVGKSHYATYVQKGRGKNQFRGFHLGRADVQGAQPTTLKLSFFDTQSSQLRIRGCPLLRL